ncbi:hypothetical protein DPMN_037434 [Dreissena polymorpha]|uniref:Uncharacterized protein n=1 Tax=Dreissena polymorpha TaxID=45954 RepID=A0A9D4MAZ4_DREPO|nr:hypothetical protein DPMN_037434 [Dreissena polymorpha]
MACMRTQVRVITVAVILFNVINGTNSASCDSQKSCSSCTNKNLFVPREIVECNWCPLDRKCHNVRDTSGTVNNPCNEIDDIDDINIKEKSTCYRDVSSTATYNPEMAVLFANLSAVAYADAENLHNCLRKIHKDTPGYDFEIHEAIGRKCPFILDYKECFAYTAISHAKKMIVLSFRGSDGFWQVFDQFISSYKNPIPFRDVASGNVFEYFRAAFTRLYDPCIQKSWVAR